MKDKELAEMKCGTYLNLGIVLNLKDKTDEALKYIDLVSISIATSFNARQ